MSSHTKPASMVGPINTHFKVEKFVTPAIAPRIGLHEWSWAGLRHLEEIGNGRLRNDAMASCREVHPKARAVLPLQLSFKGRAIAELEDERRAALDLPRMERGFGTRRSHVLARN